MNVVDMNVVDISVVDMKVHICILPIIIKMLNIWEVVMKVSCFYYTI